MRLRLAHLVALLAVTWSASPANAVDREVPAKPTGEPAARMLVEGVFGGEGSGRRNFGQWLAGIDSTAMLERPYAVAWQGDELLVADPGAGRVVRFDARGRERGATSKGAFGSPIGLAVCPAGIVVTDSSQGSVTVLDRRLRVQRRLAEGLARPTGVACDERRIWVVETAAHRVLVLKPEGGIATVFGSRGLGDGEYNFPTAITLDGETLLVGDTLNFRIQRLSAADGRHLGSFGRLGDAPGETPRIKGLAVDSAGWIWVSDGFLDQIAIFDRNGALLGDFGRSGGDGGEFAFPTGLAAGPGGRVAVVDSLNRRVQILRLIPPEGVAPADGPP